MVQRLDEKGVGLDGRMTESVYGGLVASGRNVEVPIEGHFQKQYESLYRAYLYWLVHPNWAVRGASQFERFTRDENRTNFFEPYRIETFYAPVNISYFHPSGMLTKLTTTYVRQTVELVIPSEENGVSNSGISSFFLLDAVLGHRYANRRGIIRLEGRNLLNEEFLYRGTNFQYNEYVSRYIPGRLLFLRLT